jgi:hypothetical protein
VVHGRRGGRFGSLVALVDGERQRRRRGACLMAQRASPGPAVAWSRRRWGGRGLTVSIHGDPVGATDSDMWWGSFDRRRWRWRWHPMVTSYTISKGWGR